MGTVAVDEKYDEELLGCAGESLDVMLQDAILETDLAEIRKLDKLSVAKLEAIPRSLSYFSWSSSGISHYGYPYDSCSPNLVAIFNYFRKIYPGTANYGCHNDRYVAGSRTWSSHAWGAAYDIKLPNRTITIQAMNFLIAHYVELGINTIHDYITQRMWKPGQGWVSASIGSIGGTWIHVETTRAAFMDGRSVEERVGSAPPPPPPGPPNPWPYDPWHHLYGLWPVANKVNLTYGTGYANGTQQLQNMVTYFNHVVIFEAGQRIDDPFTVFTQSSVTAVRNLNAFFNPTGANVALAAESWNGYCGPETWKIIDFLASRVR